MKSIKKQMTRILGIVLAAAMLIMSAGPVNVSAAAYFKPNDSSSLSVLVNPGQTTHVNIPFKVSELLMLDTVYAESSNTLVEVQNLKFLKEDGTERKLNSGINEWEPLSLDFDIVAGDALKIGYNTITVKGLGSTMFDDGMSGEMDLMVISIYTTTELEDPYITASGVNYNGVVKPGNSMNMNVTIKNEGDIRALNTFMTLDFGSSGIIPDYTVSKIKIGELAAKGVTSTSVPIKVLPDAEPGLHKVTATFTCKNKAGDEFGPFSQDIYVTIVAGEKDTAKGAELSFTTNDNYKVIAPGTDDVINLALENIGEGTASNISVTCTSGLDTTTGITKRYTTDAVAVSAVKSGKTANVEIPVSVSKDISSGLHEIGFTLKYTDASGKSYSKNLTMYLNVPEKEQQEFKTELVFTTTDNYKIITPGTDAVINLSVENLGVGTASDISVTCTSGLDTATGITKRYTTDAVSVKDLKVEKSAKVEIPVSISGDIASGLHEISFTLKYTGDSGKSYSKNLTMYLSVSDKDGSGKPTGEVRNYISIKNASQTPSAPVAGEKVTVSFDVVNDGNADISNLRFFGQNLGASGFEPVSNEPYTSVGSVAKGATKRVNMSFRCGEMIADGMNTLAIGYDYVDADGLKQADSVTLYILNVKSTSVDVGRPKLIVNAYGTDKEVLKAGDEFAFSFTLKNTHANKAAKNIKITLSQDEGVFSPASGTNIFYIEQIKAGEESVQTITLKTRADATTGDYAVKLLVEYEYDDMSDVDKEKGGVSEENNIKLRATENYRPVIENIYIDTWQPIYVGNAVDLSFEFYNMGKSTLGNVYVTVEGDFELANNSQMSYIGAIQGYGQEYVNPQVVPLVPGEAQGVLVVHFEDSNGDEVTLSQNFSCFVEDMGGGEAWEDDPWSGDYPIDEPWGDDPWSGENPGEETAKKILGLPIWAFILVCVGAAAVIAVVVIVIVKKAKNNKKAKDDDDEDY